MKDRVLPIVVGLLAGWVTVFGLERLNHFVYPMPEGADLSTKEGVVELMASLPTGAFVLLFASWMIAATLAGMVTGRLNPEKRRNNSILVGVVLSIGALANMIMIPHPTWLIIASAVGYIPCAYFGATLVNTKNNEAGSYH